MRITETERVGLVDFGTCTRVASVFDNRVIIGGVSRKRPKQLASSVTGYSYSLCQFVFQLDSGTRGWSGRPYFVDTKIAECLNTGSSLVIAVYLTCNPKVALRP